MSNKLSIVLKNKRNIIILLYIVLLIFGLLHFRDYGISTDETSQRYHSLVVFKKLFPQFTNDIVTSDGVDFSKLPELSEYTNRYYGVAIQIPLVFIEAAFQFTLPIRSVFYIRHLYIFLLWYCSVLSFYGLIKKCFETFRYSIIGLLVYIICPIVFASSFYNIKDNVCMSLSIISIFFLSEIISSNHSIFSRLMYAITSALAINSRIVTIVYVAFGLTFYFVFRMNKMVFVEEDNKSTFEVDVFKLLLDVVLIGALVLIFYYVFTPVLWDNAIENFLGTLKVFSNYTTWTGKNFFWGEYIQGDSLPWYYLPVSTIISLPIIYTIYIVCGGGFWIQSFFSQIINLFVKKHYEIELCEIIADILGVVILITYGYVMVCRPVLYTGWRHFYFLWPAYCFFIVYAVKKCSNLIKKNQKALIIIVNVPIIVSISITLLWMFINHPYEYVYYNYPTRMFVNDYFERDYWGVSGKDALEDLVDLTNPDNTIDVYMTSWRGSMMVSDDIKEKVNLVNRESADYLIEIYSHISQTDSDQRIKSEGWRLMKQKRVGSIILYSIYER